ncbi:hypothetical protein SERLA73DRAFT_175771 [Serpula lacrymans var. lacrymans S7.3]|uniref:DUF6699 domain-containing protein n=2 Tax=Serpula lacrymans var. lacrymans TaxID=341189 RepID=F8PIU0_SERL3|nr:uncharacterized protein SERLADRAFT_458362 [Serpula lacrymans var. lacrymans S7.9]EGO04040.1 hypothetical protein SERLA73DRAFT_175771 [Serpula lacrymans var. lacrymans S7.3]EGO29957.1 hypothetical protein SERLADRAFT_458362 [Serpula lacrymans var. lacrymans S7.9]
MLVTTDPTCKSQAIKDVYEDGVYGTPKSAGAGCRSPFPHVHAPPAWCTWSPCSWGHCPTSPIHARPVFSTPSRHSPRRQSIGGRSTYSPHHRSQRPGNSILRATRPLDPLPSPAGSNPGVQVDPEPRPAWAHPHIVNTPRNTPHNHSWGALPPINGSGALAISPRSHTPALPIDPPDQHVWNFPGGSLSWTPHPQPGVDPSTFWTPNAVLNRTPRQWSGTPLDSWTAARLTGGWPLPGTCVHWTPGTWPPVCYPNNVPVRLAPWLIPNPSNTYMPQIVWDVSQDPSRSKRLTGAHVMVDMGTVGGEQATYPPADKIHIACDAGFMGQLWGPIVIQKSSCIKVGDILRGIYEYFQQQLTQEEVDHIARLGRDNYCILLDACYKRCLATPGLPGYEQSLGFRRVDCLGDKKIYWGLWVTYNSDSTWQLNLGLINQRS